MAENPPTRNISITDARLVNSLLLIAIAYVISNVIIASINAWITLKVLPEKNLEYKAAEIFQENRNEFVKNFFKQFEDMRTAYHTSFKACYRGLPLSSAELNSFRGKNQSVYHAVLDNSSNIIAYFGKSISDAADHEIQWYKHHVTECPDKIKFPTYDSLSDDLQYRQSMLSLLMVKHLYNPSRINSHDEEYLQY